MEFLLIGESKLKIVISEEEMKKYNLNVISETTGGRSFRRSFWRVLDMAKEEVGFDPSGDKVLIQFYPVKSGGCEVFVTKLGILPEASARLVSKSDRIAMLSRRRGFYSFDSLADLVAAARAIKRVAGDKSPTADAYFCADKYYLSIEEYGKGGEPIEFPSVLEFAKLLTADFGLYISEQGDSLCDGDAIEKFSAL